MSGGVEKKYAGLPDLDTQPDVFESPDVPALVEVGTDVDRDGESDGIYRGKIDARVAFKHFKKSDQGRVGVDKGMYIYEIPSRGEGITGTPMEKMKKLQYEIDLLSKEISTIRNTEENLSGGNKENAPKSLLVEEGVNPADMAKQVLGLKNQLDALNVGKTFGSLELSAENRLAFLHQKHLTEQIEKNISLYKEKGKASEGERGQSVGKSEGSGDCLKYELICRQEDSGKASDVAVLEKRIASLERLLGGDMASVLSAGSEQGLDSSDLFSVVESIVKRVDALDAVKLQKVDAKIQAVLGHLRSMKGQKGSTENELNSQKLDALYESWTKSEAVVPLVPSIVERLTALKGIHENAATVSQSLTDVESSQRKMEGDVAKQRELLMTVQKEFETNVNTIKDNFDALEQRLANICKKLEAGV
eukprot:Nk52_evm5s390 gene=Nk52_evmTU5s390